ncbi:MAG: hypothetical protein NW215_09590 [Hyphomicrobiales bacterium]|nr:hypothetical protein [Hyphomicrobiales bacterium]
MRFSVLAPLLIVFACLSGPASAQDKLRNITFDGVVVIDGNGVANKEGLLKLGCEPLAVLRHRVLVDQGFCFCRPTFYSQFVNRICQTPPGETCDEQRGYNRVVDWTNRNLIREVESLKNCRGQEAGQ